MTPTVAESYIKKALRFGPRPGRHVQQGWVRCPLCENSVYGDAHPSETVEKAVERSLRHHLAVDCRGRH